MNPLTYTLGLSLLTQQPLLNREQPPTLSEYYQENRGHHLKMFSLGDYTLQTNQSLIHPYSFPGKISTPILKFPGARQSTINLFAIPQTNATLPHTILDNEPGVIGLEFVVKF